MCADQIGKVASVHRAAGCVEVDLGSVRREMSLLALDPTDAVRSGDWVVAYQGYVLHVIDEPTALEILEARGERP